MKPDLSSLHTPARLAMAAVLAIVLGGPVIHGQEPAPAPSSAPSVPAPEAPPSPAAPGQDAPPAGEASASMPVPAAAPQNDGMAKAEAAPAAPPPPVAPDAAGPDPAAPAAPAAAEGPAPGSAIPSPSPEPAPAVSTADPAPLSGPAAAGASIPPSSGPQSPPAPSIQLPQPDPLSAPPVPRARLQQQLPASASVPPPVPLAAPGGNDDALPDEDILDIRGPIHIEPPSPWIPWTAGAAGTVLAAFLLWKWLRRPRRAVPPWRLALEKLAASRALMDSGNAQPFSHAVSETVRSFIEQSFPVRAAHRTTSEFLHDLVKLPNSPLAAHRATLAEFLEYCDLTKFARWSLTLPEMEAMLSKAQNFISSIGQAAAAVPPGSSAPEPAAVPEVHRA